LDEREGRVEAGDTDERVRWAEPDEQIGQTDSNERAGRAKSGGHGGRVRSADRARQVARRLDRVADVVSSRAEAAAAEAVRRERREARDEPGERGGREARKTRDERGEVPDRSRRRRGAELETAVLDAAWDELKTNGYADLTFDAVAARAGTSRTVLYRRWATREALARDAIARQHAQRRLELPDEGDFRADLIALLAGLAEIWADIIAVASYRLGAHFAARFPHPETEPSDRPATSGAGSSGGPAVSVAGSSGGSATSEVGSSGGPVSPGAAPGRGGVPAAGASGRPAVPGAEPSARVSHLDAAWSLAGSQSGYLAALYLRAQRRGQVNLTGVPELVLDLPLQLVQGRVLTRLEPPGRATAEALVDQIVLPLLRAHGALVEPTA
jgi:hypothetical protein